MNTSDASAATTSKGLTAKIAAERAKLTERLAELDRQEQEEADRARRASGLMLAEAFAKQGVILNGKREAGRLAKAIADIGIDKVLARLGA